MQVFPIWQKLFTFIFVSRKLIKWVQIITNIIVQKAFCCKCLWCSIEKVPIIVVEPIEQSGHSLITLPAPWQQHSKWFQLACCGSNVKASWCILARLVSRLYTVKLSDPGVRAWRSDRGAGGGGGKAVVLKRESFTANRIEEFNHCKTPNPY